MAKELQFRSLVLVFLLLFQLPCAVYGKSEGKKEPLREKLYLEASLSNRKPFVGQEVLLTYTLYFTDIAPKISDAGKPEHKGLWVQEITPEGYINSSTVTVNGVSYRRAVVKQMKLVPMQSGTLTVTNYRLRCLTPVSHEISFNNQKDSEQLIAGPDASIDARPLPEPVPEHFSGAVGKFTLQVAPEKNTLHVGEPLVLNISINGKGNLKTFPPIVIALPKEFRQDKPNVATVLQEKSGSSADAISTTIVAIASQPGSFRFSPVNLIYFDPDKKSYETIYSPQIPVTVLPGSPGSPANDVAAAEPPAESAKQADTSNPWTMAIIAVVVIAIASAIVMLRKKTGVSEKEPAQKKGSPTLPSEKQSERSPETLRQQVFESLKRLGIDNPAGMTGNELKILLTEKKALPEENGEALLQLLKSIDQAIYTPGSTSTREMDSLYQQAKKVLDTITSK